jgi:hypothetical protein
VHLKRSQNSVKKNKKKMCLSKIGGRFYSFISELVFE